MEDQILNLLGQEDYAPANVPELLQQLQWPPHRQQELQQVLRGLEQSGQITRTKGNRYIKSSEADLIPGRIQINRAGKGFLQPDAPGLKEIMIPADATSTAMHGDRVLVRRDLRPRGLRPEKPGQTDRQESGSVIRILERKRTQIVGTFQRGRKFLFVIPDDPRMPHDVYVPEPRDVGRPARDGDKVVVELQEWESRNSNPEGEVIEVLGSPEEGGVDMLSVLRQYQLPLHFPKNVLAEARAIGTTVAPHELAGREDCRHHQVVTIDPDDAKDFDDAICLQPVAPDQWRLWVHIADVSHYVKPGTALDTEARKRGNSTYLVDRVIPMLPEALSNELCSLKPNVERLTKCVEFLVSNDGQVLSTKFYPAVIHSQRRFTYKEVFALLQQPPTDAISRMLHDAHELAQKIRRLRFKAGSLELDFPENKIRLDEQGRVLRIERVENDVSHQLIEEYMLLDNVAVATQLMARNIPAVYRVHEEPDARRLNEYREDVLSHQVPCGNLSKRPEVSKLLQKLGTIPIGAALKIGFLRSLMRARYAVEPLGHYGLAKAKYTHFTSPIRRYADLVVHRALFDKGAGQTGSLKAIADEISDTERNSADAERDSKDVKMYAYLRAQLDSGKPEVYSGLVIDVRNFGFFVDVSGLAMSGLVHLSSIADDFFIFDEARGQLTGRRTRRVIRLGDRVEVQIAKVDSFKKQVDFRLAQTGKVQRDDRRDDRNQPLRPRQNARPSFKPSTQAGSGQRFKSGPRPGGSQGSRPGTNRGPRHGGSNSQRPGGNQGSRPGASNNPRLGTSQGPRPSGSQGSRPGAGNSQRSGSKPESQRPQIPSSHSQRKFGGQGQSGQGGQRRRRR